MKKVLKIVSFSLLFALLFSSFASAEQNSGVVVEEKKVEVYDVQENVGVSTTSPGEEVNSGEIGPFSTQKPTTSWDLSTKGRYNFSGKASFQELYTNYLLTGKSTFKIVITNHNEISNLDVKLKRNTKLIDPTEWSYSVKPGTQITAYVPVDSSLDYYLIFDEPSNFSGYIE